VKPVLFIALFAMLGAGLVAMTVATTVAPGPAVVEGAAVPAEDNLAPLRGELAELTRRMEDVSMRLASLESRAQSAGAPAPARVAADGVQASELEELRSLLAAMRDPEARPEQFEEVVLDVIAAKEQREREARDERRREQEAERMEARIADLTEKLGLDGYQAGEMKRILTDEQTARNEFFQKMRENESWDRDATGQYQQYVEDSSRSFGGFGGFGGGRPPGGDDRSGGRGGS